MEWIEGPDAMARWAQEAHRSGHTIGFVPTMGFLHRGHASLMALLRPRCDRLVVSVYVNPLQFGPDEDLDRYPRDREGDGALCEAQGVDALFMPQDLYPDGFATAVAVHGLTDGLCGAHRPGHFEGVTTVCARLFGLTGADLAAFGDKDYQQLIVIRRMVRDLALPVRIVPGPLIRDEDGVAMSSRNKYLAPDQRRRATSLSRALAQMQRDVARGRSDLAALRDEAIGAIDCDRLDYLEIVDAESLQTLDAFQESGGIPGEAGPDIRPARALVAAFYGTTRLIDNVAIGPELSW